VIISSRGDDDLTSNEEKTAVDVDDGHRPLSDRFALEIKIQSRVDEMVPDEFVYIDGC